MRRVWVWATWALILVPLLAIIFLESSQVVGNVDIFLSVVFFLFLIVFVRIIDTEEEVVRQISLLKMQRMTGALGLYTVINESGAVLVQEYLLSNEVARMEDDLGVKAFYSPVSSKRIKILLKPEHTVEIDLSAYLISSGSIVRLRQGNASSSQNIRETMLHGYNEKSCIEIVIEP